MNTPPTAVEILREAERQIRPLDAACADALADMAGDYAGPYAGSETP